ncbi:MAG: methyltransferase domain-containing protein [Desulfosalsimonadaceae bacterium]
MNLENHPISAKYELETVPIGIGGKRMQFYRVGNWEPFIEKLFAEGGSFTDFPHWIKIWEASLVLADYLLDAGLDCPQSVLEIGAGMGITGMFLAAFGHEVTLTDNQEDSLALLRLNVEYNGLSGNAQVRFLDWHEPDLEDRFDIICGAEVIYRESAFAPLTALFRRHLKPGGRIFLAHDRQRNSTEKFISRLPQDMTAESIGKTFSGKDMARRIIIHTINQPSL